MIFQMNLLEAENRGRNERSEEIAVKLIRRGRSFDEIHEDTGLSLQRIEELAQKNSVE